MGGRSVEAVTDQGAISTSSSAVAIANKCQSRMIHIIPCVVTAC